MLLIFWRVSLKSPLVVGIDLGRFLRMRSDVRPDHVVKTQLMACIHVEITGLHAQRWIYVARSTLVRMPYTLLMDGIIV